MKYYRGILLCTDILSRGIDIENVDSVVQYDPPKTATSFVHRCGRTARLDRVGDAIIFLLPNEDAYVNFMFINQRVPIEEFKEDIFKKSNCEATIKKIQILASKERELYEKGKLAFVSYIRAYTKHDCSHIFRVNELDYAKLAQGFGLLHLPKMPEIKKGIEYKPFIDCDISKIEYK
jgi:ATP-dependent RNA helicase DDX55/SPB4